jgi:HAD superfamily hydrolase (TIGR01484 family)
MGKFSGLLICSDFDGTVARKGVVTPQNAEAIRYFQDHGGLFTLATGRSLGMLSDNHGDFICNTSLVAMNGAVLYNIVEKRIDYECWMDPSYADVVVQLLREARGIQNVVLFPRSIRGAVSFSPIDEQGLREMLREEMYKIVFHVDTEWSDDLKSRMIALSGDAFSVCRSWINGVELNSSNCDKGKTARRLAQMVGADQLIGVGDYENDLPLICEADIGYAMGNAVESLKQVADFVLDTVQNDGFAKMIYAL